MKKTLAVLLVLIVAFAAFANGAQEAGSDSGYKVAMITDYGDITDQSFNQTTYEACRDWSEAHNVPFKYYKPATDSDADRIGSIELAIADGYNVIVMPGYAFGTSISTVAPLYPDVKFIALDVSIGDLGGSVPANVYSMVYQEELCGYMAGYAAVKLGYTKLGYLGGMAVPAVVRYGYGYVQGANAAAKELGKKIEIKYVYGNQFFGSAEITAVMDTWYKAGTEVVFACGGSIYVSAAESAAKYKAKVIGVDVDQAPTIDAAYGKGMTVTSAMKGLYNSAQDALQKTIVDGNFSALSGRVANLGIKGGFVGLPEGSTQFKAGAFTLEDYKALVKNLENGKIAVDNNIEVDFSTIENVSFFGNIL